MGERVISFGTIGIVAIARALDGVRPQRIEVGHVLDRDGSRATVRALLRPGRRLLLLCLASSYPCVANMAPQAPTPSRADAERFEVTPTRLPAGTRVVLDAAFGESFWATAARLPPMRMVEPREAEVPVETRVRLAYDTDFFYLAIECMELPGEVRGRLMARDARLDPDDRVEFWFDPFHTGSTAYWFQIGAGGSRGDAWISDFGFRFNKSWDGIWDGSARLTEDGWVAEVAIPFKTLAFAAGQTTWGFNITRQRKNGDEEHRWAHPRQSHRFFKLPYGGVLLDMVGARQGVGLDMVPYVKGSLVADRGLDDHLSRTADVGGEVFYRLSPALGVALTVNTDFAETEVDGRQVNLSRFPLFFPEKRDFFLDDAPLFEFGIPGSGGDEDQVRPFFSRRIGLDSNGEAVPIVLGGKVTGRAGPWSVGVLQALLDQDGRVGDQGVGVARVSHDLGAESAIGVIGTVGEPNASQGSATYGVDARFGNTALFGPGQAGNVWGYWLGSAAEGGAGGDGDAFGVKAEYQSAAWRHAAQFQGIEAGFAPRLGFVRRADVRDVSWSHTYTWRNDEVGVLRRIESRVSARVTTSFGGAKDSWRAAWRPVEVTFASDDRISYEVEREFERVPTSFPLRDGVAVGSGDYSTTQHTVNLETALARTLSLQANARVGSLYSGHLAQFGVEPTVYLGRYVQLGGGYQEYRVSLREGRFVTRVVEVRVDATFTPGLSWRNLVQFDNDSDDLTMQSRLHWIQAPGADVYLVAVYGWDRDAVDGGFRPADQALTLKAVHTLRF